MTTTIAALTAVAGLAGVPTPIVPNLMDDAGMPYQGPGAFPDTVTGATFAVTHQVTPLELADLASGALPEFDYLDIAVVGTGPFPVTTAWHNAGDNDLNISPIDPMDPLAFPGPALDPFRDLDPSFGPNIGNLSIDNGLMPNYAWTPNASQGVMMASIATNFQDSGFTFLGFPTGPLKAHANASISRGGGAGYNMNHGRYVKGGEGAIFVSMNHFSIPTSVEASLPHAVFWFPFAQDWTAGWVAGNDPMAAFRAISFDADDDGMNDTTVTAANPNLSDTIATWTDFTNSEGRIEIPGVTPADGVMFLSSSDNGESEVDGMGNLIQDSGKIIGMIPDATGWDFVVRVVDGIQADGLGDRPQPFPPSADPMDREIRNAYAFVFVPFDGCNVAAGHVDGATGSIERGTANFAVNKLAAGTYLVTVPGKTNTDGGLMLQIAGAMPNDQTLADRTYADYEYRADLGGFVVTTFEMVPEANPFGFTYSVRDADFNVAWVDYSEPLEPKPCMNDCPADVNMNGMVEPTDFGAWLAAFNAGDLAADQNGDGMVTPTDFGAWLANFNAGCD